jgi:hypothetical protein
MMIFRLFAEAVDFARPTFLAGGDRIPAGVFPVHYIFEMFNQSKSLLGI